VTNFIAIGYHGSKDELLKEKIDFNYMQYEDHFLGRGFYIFRDSYNRAVEWADNRHKDSKDNHIYQVEIDTSFDKILNFTSTNWGYELDVLELFLEICKKYSIHFGVFLDILIDKFKIDIDAIVMIDLRDSSYFVPIVSEHKTLFAFGDIQICIKSQNIISGFEKC